MQKNNDQYRRIKIEKEIDQELTLIGNFLLEEPEVVDTVMSIQKQINRDIDKRISEEHFVCKKGCFYCCIGWEVNGTISELLLLIKELNKLPEEERKRIKNRLYKYRSYKDIEDKKCPFLNGGLCIVYSGRPFVCRTYVSYNEEICKKREFFEFPKVIDDCVNIINNYLTDIDEPFDLLFTTKYSLKSIEFNEEKSLFYLKLTENIPIYP